MKKTLLILVFIITPFYFYGQSKKKLRKMYSDLTIEHSDLTVEYNELVERYNALYEKYSVSFDTPENYIKSIFKLLKNKNKDEIKSI